MSGSPIEGVTGATAPECRDSITRCLAVPFSPLSDFLNRLGVGLTLDVKLRAAFQARRSVAARCLPPMSCLQRVATRKQRDAAPVLFGRGASAPDHGRRLVNLNAKLCGGRTFRAGYPCSCLLGVVSPTIFHGRFSVPWPARSRPRLQASVLGARTCVLPGEVSRTPLACGCRAARSPAPAEPH